MSEFEKEFNKCLHFGFIPNEPQNKIIERFKDWQPPKPREVPVEIPQFVAGWFEEKMSVAFSELVSAYSFSGNEATAWVYEWVYENGGIDLLCKMKLYGYTVEKEKMYRLKNKITNQYINMNPYNGNCHESMVFGKCYKCAFTQSEIDEMEADSYEQIEVEP